MPAPPKLPPKPRFRDPRNTGGFCARHYPKLEGEPALATGSHPRQARIQREFQAAYYELNRAHANLRQARRLTPRTARVRQERLHLQRIERALRRRDALENHYAPFGIVVEPTMRHGIAVGLRFTGGDRALSRRAQSEAVEVFSAEVPIPVPSDFSWDRLVRGVRRALAIS